MHRPEPFQLSSALGHGSLGWGGAPLARMNFTGVPDAPGKITSSTVVSDTPPAGGGFRASQTFSRLYMIPGAGHCLYAPDSSSINGADFLIPLISWVQHGIAPGTVEADTFSFTTHKITLRQKVRPYNALAPVTPAPGSLNGYYHYLGTYH